MDPLLERMAAAAKALPEDWARLSVAELVLRMRREVRLYQWTLAFRIGARQAAISKVEHGRDLRVSTLRRLFDAMGCDLIILPVPRASLAAIAEVNRREEWRRRLNRPF